jgi:hypothetical protein
VEAKDEWVDATGCIRLFYQNFVIFFALDYKGSLVISFPINMTPMTGGEVRNLIIHLPPLAISFPINRTPMAGGEVRN